MPAMSRTNESRSPRRGSRRAVLHDGVLGLVLSAFAASFPACSDDTARPDEDDAGARAVPPASGGGGSSAIDAGTGGMTAASGGAGGSFRPLDSGAAQAGDDAGNEPDPVDAGDAGDAGTGKPARDRWLAFAVHGADEQPLVVASTRAGTSAVSVAPSLSGFTPPTWRSDGQQLLYVEYFCCGFSNGAFVVDVGEEALGSPARLHAPLSGGATVRDADYSPDGRFFLAQFVDAEATGAWSVRSRAAADGDWQKITPGGPWNPSQLRPRWSRAKNLGVVVEGTSGSPAQRVYVIDLEHDPPRALLAHEAPAGGVSDVVWHPNRDGFVIAAENSLIWATVSADGVTAEPLTSRPALPAPLFDSAGDSVLFRFLDDAAPSGPTEGLESRALGAAGLGAATPWFVSAPLHAVQVQQFTWLNGASGVAFVGDAETDEVFELFRAASDQTTRKLSAPLPTGSAVSGVVAVASRVVYTIQSASGTSQTAEWVDHATSAAPEPLVRFSPGMDGWANVAGAVSPGGHAVFVAAQEIDAVSGTPANAQLLFANGSRGAATRVVGPMPAGAYVTEPYGWAPDGRRFAYAADADADGIVEVAVVTLSRDGEATGAPRTIAVLAGAPGSAPGAFAWQP